MRYILCISLSLSILFITKHSLAQSKQPLTQARHYVSLQEWDSAAMIYKGLYEAAPFDQKVYEEYLHVLLQQKAYDNALNLATYMSEVKRGDPAIQMDIAQIHLLKKNKKQANAIFDDLIHNVAGKNSYEVKKIANAFRTKGMNAQAIQVYEKAMKSSNRMDFSDQLVSLYLAEGMLEKSLPLYLEIIPYNPSMDAEMKGKLLEYMDKDPKNKQKVIQFINKQLKQKDRQNQAYVGLLTWVNQLDGNQDAALAQLINLDKQQPNSMHKEIFSLGENAYYNRHYKLAKEAFQYIVMAKEASTFYESAYTNLVRATYAQLITQKPVQAALIQECSKAFEAYFQQYPNKVTQVEYLWYMEVVAKFQGQPALAIQQLDSVLTHARVFKEYIGHARLAIGDYHLMNQEPWQANLSYVQVDKLFRQDKLGEEARFKQAKLAFYRGDFEWAEMQLNILKESTTELISNDAMSLSIMITENTFTDSNIQPLKLYAQADLLLFQYQYEEAMTLLDSIIAEYSEHDILDDVYMLQAKIAKEEGRYADAVAKYEMVIQQFSDDVLADDALFQAATIYEEQLQDSKTAQQYYENLIVQFPNSTLTGIARAKYAKLQQNINKP